MNILYNGCRMSEAPVTDYTKLGLLQDMFMRQAKKTPNNTAVVTQNGKKMHC